MKFKCLTLEVNMTGKYLDIFQVVYKLFKIEKKCDLCTMSHPNPISKSKTKCFLTNCIGSILVPQGLNEDEIENFIERYVTWQFQSLFIF